MFQDGCARSVGMTDVTVFGVPRLKCAATVRAACVADTSDATRTGATGDRCAQERCGKQKRNRSHG